MTETTGGDFRWGGKPVPGHDRAERGQPVRRQGAVRTDRCQERPVLSSCLLGKVCRKRERERASQTVGRDRQLVAVDSRLCDEGFRREFFCDS